MLASARAYLAIKDCLISCCNVKSVESTMAHLAEIGSLQAQHTSHRLPVIYCRLGQLFAQWPACPQTKHSPPATPGSACPANTMTAASVQHCMRHSTAPADTPHSKAMPSITLAKQGQHLWQMCMQEACRRLRRDARPPVRAPAPPLAQRYGHHRGRRRGLLVIWALGCPSCCSSSPSSY